MSRLLGTKNQRVIKLLVYSQLIAAIVILIMPVKAIVSNLEFLLLVNLIFTSLTIFAAIFIYKLFSGFLKKGYLQKPMSTKQLANNINLVSGFSILGFIMLFIDRIYIKGIDYSLGLRGARHQWLDTAGSSILGIIGNIFIPFGFVCIFFLVMHYKNIATKKKLILFIAATTGVIGHAALNGGRSNILLAIALIIITLALKNESIKFKSFSGIIKKMIIGSIAIFYVSTVTLSSAALGNISMKTLTSSTINSLYGQPYGYYDSIENISDDLYLVLHSLSYLYHGQWTAQATYAMDIREGNNTFWVFSYILSRMGLVSAPLQPSWFSELGLFISLPGAFYYDFGFSGVLFFSLFLGCMLGIVMLLINKSSYLGGIKLAFIIYVMAIVLLSPIVPAYGLLYFNFVILAFVLLGIYNSVFYREKSNWILVIGDKGYEER